MKKRDQSNTELSLNRRTFVSGAAAIGISAPSLFNTTSGFAQSDKTGVARVWGEPGPYGGTAVAAMNEWAQKNAPGLKFEIETIPWDGVYVKLMTDLAARRPPSLISVKSPIAMQLMAEGILLPVDDLVQKIGPSRIADGMKWDFWGKWKDKQYIIPAHHQPHLLLVRMDIAKELGLKDPDTWDWNDLLGAAKTISRRSRRWLVSAWRSDAISALTITSPRFCIPPADGCSIKPTNLRSCSIARKRSKRSPS